MGSAPVLWVALLMVLAGLAGCVEPAGEDLVAAGPTDEPAKPAKTRPTPAATDASAAPDAEAPSTGALVVTAVFTNKAPLSGVELKVANLSRTTDVEGKARFDELPVGTHIVHATKSAHRAAQASVEILSGEESALEIVLAAADGGAHAHGVGFASHKDLYTFDGHFDCSATYFIITGDCLVVVENVTKDNGVPDPASRTTTERNIIEFPLDVTWSHLIVELAWNAPEAGYAEGMTLSIEPANASKEGESSEYAREYGPSPVVVRMRPGEPHETATFEEMPNPTGGEVLRARAFVMGAGHHPGGTNFLGLGAAKGMKFTLYVSVFYGEEPPDGYTAVK